VDLTYVLTTLRRAWWLLTLAAALGTVAAAVVNATSPVVYQAQVQQFVSIADSSDSASNILSGSQFTLQRVKSYTQVATSAQVLQPVIRQLKLPMGVSDLAGHVEATNPLDTVLIELSVTDTDPARAAQIANAVGQQLSEVVQQIESPQSGAPAPVKLTTTAPATPPTAPVSPRTTLNLALGLLVGLAAGAGGALLREQLNTTVKTPDDVESVTGGVPLGLVPFDATARTQPLVSGEQTDGRAEAFRTLRTNLQFADVDRPPRCIVVTSAMPDEGKTTSACNIALTLALTGSRVVLVEADLRKPRVCDYLGLDSGAGLTNVLAGQHGLADVLVPWKRRTLTVLPAGPVPPNPSELLGSQHMGTLLQALAGEYDHVVIDTPPLLPVTDAAVLATIADGAVLIVRHGRSSRDDLELAIQALAAVNARLLGTVLNFIPQRRRGYGYGYGYTDDNPTATAKAGRSRGASRSSRAQARAKANARRRRHVAGKNDVRIDVESLLGQRQPDFTAGQPGLPPQPLAAPSSSPSAAQPAVSGWFLPTAQDGGAPDGSRRPQAPHVDGHVDGQVAGYDDGDAYGDAHGESHPDRSGDRYVDGIVDVDSSPFPVPQRGVRT
jgi:capsular exopolysaccharide synthesis family protein